MRQRGGLVILYRGCQVTSSIMHVDDMYDTTVRFVPRTITLQQYVCLGVDGLQRALFNTTVLTLTAYSAVVSCTIVGYGSAGFARGLCIAMVLLL